MIRPWWMTQVKADWTAASGPAQILNKPAIPAAQDPADWTAVSGVTRILNKPTLFSGAYADLTGKPTIPTVKRIETYTGTTNASGQMTVAYPLAFAQVPNVQTPPPALPNQVWTLTASTVNGFTAVLSQRNVVTLLGLEVLLGAVVPVASSAAQIVVIER